MSKKKILVVEDEEPIRKLLAAELEDSGYEVFLAGDGEEGFTLAAEVTPDLIITDVLMPKMNGNLMINKLRATDFGCEIPFIVISARTLMRDYFEIMEVEEFVDKPFHSADILARVEMLLGSSDDSALPEETPKESQTAAPAKKRILLLEDDPQILSRFEAGFNEVGFTVKIVQSMDECLKAAASYSPQVVFSRFDLKGTTAVELLSKLKSLPEINGTPLIVYRHSNSMKVKDEESIINAGAAMFIDEVNQTKLTKIASDLLDK